PQYNPTLSIPLSYPCNNTPSIVKTAVDGIKVIYKSGFQFKKVEVLATAIIPEAEVQLNIFDNWKGTNPDKLSKVMDTLNNHYGQGTLRMASEGFKQTWSMKRNFLSPNYTTKWDDIIKVH